eukprot:c26176_g2_i2 orf=223-2589(-)
MLNKACNNVLVVPPFECAWLVDKELRFAEAGRGCIAFDACADNDVTVVFKEKAGSKHYRTDVGPNYTVVLGSHRNTRLRIQVDGRPVVDVAGVALCPSHFERFWISIYDGIIKVGRGEPGKGVVFEWVDADPNREVQYVGLSSWDKHVGYRNIKVLPHTECVSSFSNSGRQKEGGLAQFLENPELSDLQFLVGSESRIVPAHRVALASSCTGFRGSLLIAENLVPFSHLEALQELSEEFGLDNLTTQCEQLLSAFCEGMTGDCFDEINEHNVEVVYRTPVEFCEHRPALSVDIPVNASKLRAFLDSGEYTDVEIFLDNHGFVTRAHKLVLSAWSAPFAKMFTNGMCESSLSRINLKDVAPDVFWAMLKFMYSGHLELEERDGVGSLLLPLLLLADQFGIPLLQLECSQQLLECISEDSVSAILSVVAPMQNCDLLRDTCEEFIAKNFDNCLCNVMELKELDLASLQRILQNPNLCVTSEEKILDAILVWASTVACHHGWMEADEYLKVHSIQELFGNMIEGLNELLPFVRFALFPIPLLQQLESCNLSRHISRLGDLAREALVYLEPDEKAACYEEGLLQCLDFNNQGTLIQLFKNGLMFSHRPSNFKELLYICDGDRNGVIYYAGTLYGAHLWMNPVLLKTVSVSGSSPLSRYTDAKALVSRQFQGTLFTGPCIEKGQPSTWWKIDLGGEHQLRCNYYTLRQDGSVNYLRSWNIQGSVDDENWVDLKVHKNDQTFSQPGQYASWPVCGAHALLPFRFFRVLLTGPTTSGSNPWNLCICYIELYGYFH